MWVGEVEHSVNLGMLNKEKIISLLSEHKPFLEKEMGVRKIGLFGSYAKDRQTAESDVDIYLDIQDNDDYKKILSVLLFLEKQFEKRVDLICEGSHIKPSFLRTLEWETIYA